MRTLAVALLLGLGVLFAFSANATVWVNRTIFDTDTFVATTDNVLSDEEVQQQLAVRLADRLVVRADVQQRISEALPEGLKLLAVPLTQTARDLIQRTTLRVLQSEKGAEVFNAALREAHPRIIATLEDRGTAVGIQGDSIVINLRDILTEVAQQFGVDDPNGLLARVDVPEDAGTIVLVEDASNAETISGIIRMHDRITWAVVAASVVAFALAVLISRHRRATVRNVGILLMITGVLAAVLLIPARGLVASFAQNEDAARAAFNQLFEGYRLQAFAMALIGLLIAGVAVIFGDSRIARALRSAVTGKNGDSPQLREEIRADATALRVGGLVVGALALVAWPDPTARIYVTILTVLAAYIALLWVITSDSDVAARTRDRAGQAWRRIMPERQERATEPGFRGWVSNSVGTLRIAGIVLALGALVLWPDLTWGALVGIIALTLLYLAMVDWLATAPE